jgi:hypothetical protein
MAIGHREAENDMLWMWVQREMGEKKGLPQSFKSRFWGKSQKGSRISKFEGK